jgi:branched-chain amino acid transport system ATP-binding protein
MPENTRSASDLQVRGLWSGYGAAPVLKGVSLQTRPGVTGLIGSNGAGKSTTLKSIAGLVRAQTGDIVFGGASIGGEPAHRIAQRGLIFVPEGGGLFPSMSVEDNLLMGAYRTHARRRLDDSMREALALFPRLGERRTIAARRLSGGEQQMLAIARALIGCPTLLILDEPSLGLSPGMIDMVAGAVRRIAERGVPILLCEQNASLAMRLSDYLYVMEHGEIVLEGEPAELLRSEQLTKAYFGG